MTKILDAAPLLSRRQAARTLLLALGGAALYACSGGGAASGDGDTDDDGTGTGNGTGDGTGTGTGTGEGGTTTGSATEWATGGTKSMTDAASYPDPFATPAAACVLAIAATEGPCTEAADQVRQDISEGYTGLPMRLALRVVDSDCNPVAGAKVKVWHTQITGSYSGDTPNNGMCLKDAADSSKHYFRGAQTTDERGRVDFDSCFPGWYRGRAIHIHYTVSLAGRSFTSQLVFDQSLVEEIFADHPEYKGYGQPDTSNATDNIVSRGDLASYTLTTARMSDGAMLASKDLVVSL
ncbi:MAG: protocatechuate 3,4-dioxygenase [Labilithrix sp.]|nr:protocatechuate 3,4-dioxygenase [Labilithrix sp.]